MKRLFVAFMAPGVGVGNCVIDNRDPPESFDEVNVLQREIQDLIRAQTGMTVAPTIMGFQALIDREAEKREREHDKRRQALQEYEARIAVRSRVKHRTR